MPVWLALTLCLASVPDYCRTVTPLPRPFAGLAACQQAGQVLQARWNADPINTGWNVQRVRCSIGREMPDEDPA